MVKLTVDIIARRTSGYTKKRREESMRHYLRRLTHLYLEDKQIDEIGDDLTCCPHLAVLYLYDNQLTKIPNLSRNSLLTHLYLQNNCITKLNGLTSLRKLTKLFIGGNGIVVVEGLENLSNLQELHIENQRLASGEKLLFDPRSIKAVSMSLSILNVSGNRLTSLSDLLGLSQLTQLFASDNQLPDLKEMAQLTSSWRQLSHVDLTNNPICQQPRYRDRIIVVAPRLEFFDGKEVTETAKQFLKNWQANKEAVKQKVLMRQSASHLHMRNNGGDAQTLLPQQPSIRSSYIVPALPHAHFLKAISKSTTQTPNLPSSNYAAPQRAMSDMPDQSYSRYLNTYSTYYHDNQPKPSYHVSLLTFDLNQKSATNL